MFGSCGNVDGFESSSTRRGLEKSSPGDSRRGSRDQGGRGDGPGLGISVEAGVESGQRVEFFSNECREGDGEGYEGAVARNVHPTGQGHGEIGMTLFVCSFGCQVREVDSSRRSGYSVTLWHVQLAVTRASALLMIGVLAVCTARPRLFTLLPTILCRTFAPYFTLELSSVFAAHDHSYSTLRFAAEGSGSVPTSPPLPRGSHCKSLVWSKDGTRLLVGLNTNVLLLLEYPADDRCVPSYARVTVTGASLHRTVLCGKRPGQSWYECCCKKANADLRELTAGTASKRIDLRDERSGGKVTDFLLTRKLTCSTAVLFPRQNIRPCP